MPGSADDSGYSAAPGAGFGSAPWADQPPSGSEAGFDGAQPQADYGAQPAPEAGYGAMPGAGDSGYGAAPDSGYESISIVEGGAHDVILKEQS